jgi:hypothetical protein
MGVGVDARWGCRFWKGDKAVISEEIVSTGGDRLKDKQITSHTPFAATNGEGFALGLGCAMNDMSATWVLPKWN